jgi:hypothetical protein
MKSMYLALTMAVITLPAYANSLTRAYVYRVNSATGGNEVVSGRSTTLNDHGGAWMQIVTDEIGYGREPQARLLSNALREISKEPICQGRNGMVPCRRGDTIVGYRRTWDASGHQGGNFEYVVYPSGGGNVARAAFQVR